MSALADLLLAQTQGMIQNSSITITVAADDNGDPLYSVKVAAPALTQVVLEEQTADDVAAAVTEFTDWVAEKWAPVTP